MKVLVVDDSSTMRRIIINTLTTAGVTDVTEACDGSEAVAAVAANPYDLVLMDWNMPNLSGFEALKSMRGAGHKMPIIMVTTEADSPSPLTDGPKKREADRPLR